MPKIRRVPSIAPGELYKDILAAMTSRERKQHRRSSLRALELEMYIEENSTGFEITEVCVLLDTAFYSMTLTMHYLF